MKRIVVVISLAALFTYCSQPRSTQSGSGTATSRISTRSANTATGDPADTVMITGMQKVPILGRNEAGISADLEGTWILQSISGSPVTDKSSINTSLLNKPTTEAKRDSIIKTEIVNGQIKTTTEVNIERPGSEVKKITPPQGSNYHIPEKPSLNFYGSNETFSGFTGCNKISGRFKMVSPHYISFQNAAPSTKMVCIGDYDEATFVDALHRVNSFKSVNGQLQLLEGEKVIMVFSRK